MELLTPKNTIKPNIDISLPQADQAIPREKVQPSDAVYQLNKWGTIASVRLVGSDAASTANYGDDFFVAPVAMSVIAWYASWKVACSDSGAAILLQRQKTSDTTTIGSVLSTQTADIGYKGTVTLGVDLAPGDRLRLNFSTGVTNLDNVCVTVYLVPNNLGGFFTAI